MFSAVGVAAGLGSRLVRPVERLGIGIVLALMLVPVVGVKLSILGSKIGILRKWILLSAEIPTNGDLRL